MTLDGKERVLVTGGAGFIGSHLTERLLNDGHAVSVIDNLTTGREANLAHLRGHAGLTFVQADINDRVTLDPLVRGADWVFHLAALADIVPSIQKPDEYFHANVTGTYSLVQSCRAAGTKRLVYAASSSCYGIPDTHPTPETAEIRPQYPYALTKYLGEQLVLHWSQVYGVPAVSLRLFNVYGPRSRTSGTYGAVFGVFLAQLLANKPLTVVGDGTQRRDFTFVADVVDAMVTAAKKGRAGQVYNVGSDNAQSVNRLVELLGAKETVRIPKRPGEPDLTLADTRKIHQELGWYARVPFDQGVRIMLENIDYWRQAPVWTVDTIQHATADWFKHLGKNT